MPIPKRRVEIPARRLLRDEVRDALRDAILSGQLAPGERLDDAAIQEWLGVSRTPVRQAIDALVVEGLIETAAQSYTRVVDPDPEEAPLVLGTVGVLMGGVTRWAVPRLATAQRKAAVAAAERAERGMRARDRDALAKDAVEFFAIMQRECGNPVLQQLCDSVGPSYAFRLAVTMSQGELDWDRFADLYQRLAVAVQESDADEAGRLVEAIHAPTAG